MKLRFLLILAMVGISLSVFGQEDFKGDLKRHRIDWTPTSLLGTKITLGYEVAVHEKIAIRIGGGYSILSLNGIVNRIDNAVEQGSALEDVSTTGFDFTPEIRFYPGNSGAAKGFFVGPFFRLNSYKLNEIFYEFQDDDGTFQNVKPSADVGGIGGGFVLGGRWITGGGFTFSTHFGLGGGVSNLTAKVKDVGGYTPQDYMDLETDFREWFDEELGDLDFFDFNDLNVQTDDNSISLDTENFFLPIIRFGVSIGFAF